MSWSDEKHGSGCLRNQYIENESQYVEKESQYVDWIEIWRSLHIRERVGVTSLLCVPQ